MKLAFAAAIAALLTLPADADDSAKFSGIIDVAAVYNRDSPPGHENFFNGVGTAAKRSNELALNLAQIQWSRGTSEASPLGFTLALVAGDGATVVHSGEPGGAEEFRHLYQASVAFRLSPRASVEGGVYPCHVGFEGFYTKDNWNYTRSWLGELSPYYVTGVKASYAFDDHWSAQLHVVNGWQLIHDNNDGKTVGTQIAYANGPLSASLNTMYGPEAAGDGSSKRLLLDSVVVYQLAPATQLGFSYDHGGETRPAAPDPVWDGVAVYVRRSFGRHAVAVRAEQFKDADGAISGTAQRLREATLTLELRPREHLIVKLEARHDRSTAAVFTNGRESQTLAIASTVVTF